MYGLEAAYETRLAVAASLHFRVLVTLVVIYTGRAARLAKHVQVSSVYTYTSQLHQRQPHECRILSFLSAGTKSSFVRIHHLRAVNRVCSENENIFN